MNTAATPNPEKNRKPESAQCCVTREEALPPEPRPFRGNLDEAAVDRGGDAGRAVGRDGFQPAGGFGY